MGILIGADIVPCDSNMEMFLNGQVNELIGSELKYIMASADFRMFNLEVPFADTQTPVKKWGPNLIAPSGSVKAYKEMQINLLTLANNHIMDQGEPGFLDTIDLLNKNNISYVGAGNCLAEAEKPFDFSYAGKKVGIYACAEHEFSIAEENKPGANPFNPLESFDHVKGLKLNSDYVIVLYHGGKEHYRYPSPQLQKICRKFIEKGADLVICQHSHCIGCEENYFNGKIVYGQGNFIFDRQDNEYWNTGLLVEITEKFDINYIPIIKTGNSICAADKSAAEKIMTDFYNRSNEILEDGFIQRRYDEFASEMLPNYIMFFGMKRRHFIYKVVNRLLKRALDRKWYNIYLSKNSLGIQNYIECEAHRELVLAGLKKHGGN